MSVSSGVIINNRRGIHARPSSEVAKEALKYKSNISIFYNEKFANAKDVLQIIMLELFKDARVTITVEGSDEKEALNGVKHFLEKEYDYD